jgi:hypothetical protein
MATPTFDLSGLALLENTIAAMLATPASSFIGGQSFNGVYSLFPSTQGAPPIAGPMTTAQLQQRLVNLRVAFDKLPL